jgi:hypothetical protein
VTPRGGLDGGIARNDNLNVTLNICVEPKVILLGAGQPVFTDAIDDRGQSLMPNVNPNNNHQVHYGYSSYRIYNQQVSGQLFPSAAGKHMKTLEGYVPVRLVSSQKPVITIPNVGEVKNKTTKEGNITMTIEEVTRQGNQITIKLKLQENNKQDNSWINTLGQRLELTDEQGKKLRNSGFNNNWNNNQGPNSAEGTITFWNDDQGRPVFGIGAILGGKPKIPNLKLVYNEWETINHSVPFKFKDVPLP